MIKENLNWLKWPTWLLLFILIAVTASGCNRTIENNENISEQPNDEVDETVEVHESSIYQGLMLVTETEDTKLYTASISTPTAKSEVINTPIRNWIKDQQNEFLNNVKANEQFLSNHWRAHLNIQVETKEISERMYSLIFNSYHYTGGSNGWNQVKTFNVDTNHDQILKLSDFIKLDENAHKEISALIKNDLMKQDDFSHFVFEDRLQNALENLADWKWSIDDKAFTIYFDEYEIAAGAAGVPKAVIPLDKLSNYLNQKAADLWNLPQEEKIEQEEPKKDDEFVLDPNENYVALTFDDGPHPQITPQILKTLNMHDIKATFFMLGAQVEYYPDIANQVAEAGHEVANHTEHHQDLTKLGSEQIYKEIFEASEKIKAATGLNPNLVRPPYGAYNDTVKRVFQDNQISMILWSVDSLDWKSRNAIAVNELVLKEIKPGSIVLMHDIHQSTADALPNLLASLEQEGYKFVTVSQLLALDQSAGIGPYYKKNHN